MVGMYWGTDEGVSAREALFGMYGSPGTPLFKIMVRQGEWKYIYLANGGREQLFNLEEDPEEIHQMAESNSHVVDRLRRLAIDALDNKAGEAALHERTLRAFEYEGVPNGGFTNLIDLGAWSAFPNVPKMCSLRIAPLSLGERGRPP